MPVRFALMLVLCAFLAPVARPSPQTRLRVEVKDLEGKPIDRASVTVRFMEGHQAMKLGKAKMTTWELKTNQQGVAKLPTMPQGKIRVQVIAPKYQTFGDVYDVTEDEKTISIQLKPPQQQYSAHE